MASSMGSTVVSSSTDPTSLLNTQLASALSTLGDAQFWEETISPASIRNELSSSDPSNPNSTSTLLRGMKWLLASISKGRDVSDFYPHVVKLVGATSLEVRKMVYMYLVQYADHDATTRELSLLSINSFQRGLADSEQLIRALALRVLSSIRIADILQIQILGVQKCAKDHSPYVRKCAANALSKLAPRCSADESVQKDMLLDIMVDLLNTDTSTMVLSSCLIAFCELCPNRLELLHASYRKICHLLTDMDEWGQVVILDLLSRYCRKFFKEPKGWKNGTAEKIDRERRVRRTVDGFTHQGGTTSLLLGGTTEASTSGTAASSNNSMAVFSDAPSQTKKVVKRRVIQKGFYSDEEDESVEEEVNEDQTPLNTRNILGLPGVAPPIAFNKDAEEDMDLDEDHRLLLHSATPLLKSRNAGVVLGVCSLLYYCGVSSVKVRSAIGRALVRIHRGRREIQYVVLTSIRMLVGECPSAFAPFLNDFFVKALDPPHTRIIKIDILVSLALEPAAIEAVLKELRTYIRSGDKTFVCAAIRAVGRVAELARIVYDRHGQKTGNDPLQERKTANRIALDCLYGLAVATQTGESRMVIGEAVCVMQSILSMLRSDAGDEAGSSSTVEDPNEVQSFALRRIVLMLVNTLSSRSKVAQSATEVDDDEDDDAESSDLEKLSSDLPQQAVASALWTVGEWFISSCTWSKVDDLTKSKMRFEIVRLVDHTFPEMSPAEKCQSMHLCSKILFLSKANERPMCEHVLSMGRIDIHPDVKDRARMESGLIQASIGFKHDTDNLEAQPASGTRLTSDKSKQLLLSKKPAPSFLMVEDGTVVDKSSFRFGSLSSLVGHQARGTYLPLPSWQDKNSPKALRDPIENVKEQISGVPAAGPQPTSTSGFYGPEESSSDSTDDDDLSSDGDNSSNESSDGQNDADSEGDSDEDDSSSDDDDDNNNKSIALPNANGMIGSNMAGGTNVMDKYPSNDDNNNNLSGMDQFMRQPTGRSMAGAPTRENANKTMVEDASSSDDEDSSSSSSSSGEEDYQGDVSSTNNQFSSMQEGSLLNMGSQGDNVGFDAGSTAKSGSVSSAMDDLQGLVMAPIAMEESRASDPDIERDSSGWVQLVRPAVSGGLLVKARFLRGPTKVREAQLKGLDPQLPNVVCVQLQFGNKKTDSNSLRRIRLLPKSSSGGGIQVKKALCPPDIAELKNAQVANATICMEFASASNREGDMVARFDIKTSTGGGIPIEIKPSLGDLLMPQKAPTVAEFDATMNRMQGFQRVTSKFQSSNLDAVPQAILKSAALTAVGKAVWQDSRLRMIGGLPASDDVVLVRIDCDRNSGAGMIIVCCDHAMAVNSILTILKHSVS